MKNTLLALALVLSGSVVAHAAPAPKDDPALLAAIASPSRTPAFTPRDKYRHPLQTLEFFGIKPDMTVVEIWPSSGWYTEILAPYLKDKGSYYAAGGAASLPDASAGTKKSVDNFKAKMDADPAHYGKVSITEFQPPQREEIAPAGSADLVLSFRNVHNWMEGGYEQEAFKTFYAALKPGGTLGIVEHRAKPDALYADQIKSGYVREDYVKTLAANAGFKFVASSPINYNPKDTKDYPEGVWTLPPVLTLKDKDRDKYLAIGESDRMTLKFVKPK